MSILNAKNMSLHDNFGNVKEGEDGGATTLQAGGDEVNKS